MVITIVAVLASLLLPALKTARDTAKTVKCLGNENQIGILCIQYAGDNDGFLPPVNLSYPAWPSGINWPYDQSVWMVWLAKLYTDAPFNGYCHDEVNSRKTVFHCPSHICSGSGATWEGDNYALNPAVAINVAKISAPGKTRLVGEYNGITLDSNAPYPLYRPDSYLRMRHAGRKTDLLYCDGHAASLNENDYYLTTLHFP